MAEKCSFWTQMEIEKLKTYYPRHGGASIIWQAVLPNRSKHAIQGMAHKLGLKKATKLPLVPLKRYENETVENWALRQTADEVGVHPALVQDVVYWVEHMAEAVHVMPDLCFEAYTTYQQYRRKGVREERNGKA